MCVRTASVFGERYNESEVRGSVAGAKKKPRETRERCVEAGCACIVGGSVVVGMSVKVCTVPIIHHFAEQAFLGWPESRYLGREEEGRAEKEMWEAKRRTG